MTHATSRKNTTARYGNRITAARDYAAISRAQLAELLEISENTIGRWERDEYEPNRALRQAIAKVCGVPDWFLESGFQPDVLRNDKAPRHTG
jgi:ribosome-binding protein aMBF1 (putative translation factor)